ncbi:hypothetical protein BpHYR1_053173, partial [Brachionus plicatilis]
MFRKNDEKIVNLQHWVKNCSKLIRIKLTELKDSFTLKVSEIRTPLKNTSEKKKVQLSDSSDDESDKDEINWRLAKKEIAGY